MANKGAGESQVNVAMVTLGCPKNQVDAETMLGLLSRRGYAVTAHLDQAHIIIVNTCGFIDKAKRESWAAIAQLAQFKTRGCCRQLIVAGCLAQRYHRQLALMFPHVDAFVGTGNVDKIVQVVAKGRNALTRPRAYDGKADAARLVSTFPWAYLKIAEGCSNRCAYCLIPRLRGPLRSKPLEQVASEAQRLADEGYREIVLVAQDTSQYGVDITGRSLLPQLLRKLEALPAVGRIRLMYCHPDRITEELIGIFANATKLCRYLDIPLQHSHPDILAAMGRNNRVEAGQLIADLRRKIPGIALRSTVMVGFPGETEDHFTHLLEFVKRAQLDHLGAFAFSPQRGTRAARMPRQVPEKVKSKRYRRIMLAQQANVAARNAALTGQVFEVLVDKVAQNTCYGRSCREAPEIDSLFIFEGKLNPGETTKVRCTGYNGYDLLGVIEK